MLQYWFVIPLILIYTLVSWLTKRTQEENGGWYFYALYGTGLLSLWPWVAKYSKDVLKDGLIYDVLMTLTYIVAMAAMGAGDGYTIKQWVGVFIVFVGFVIMKTGYS
jgi:hypothetical protein